MIIFPFFLSNKFLFIFFVAKFCAIWLGQANNHHYLYNCRGREKGKVKLAPNKTSHINVCFKTLYSMWSYEEILQGSVWSLKGLRKHLCCYRSPFLNLDCLPCSSTIMLVSRTQRRVFKLGAQFGVCARTVLCGLCLVWCNRGMDGTSWGNGSSLIWCDIASYLLAPRCFMVDAFRCFSSFKI